MTFDLSEDRFNEAFKDDTSFNETIQEISQGLTDNKYSISQLLEKLEFTLTSSEVKLRLKGIKFLTAILQNLPVRYIHQTQLQFIADFFSDRLKDHHSIVPEVLTGFLALQDSSDLPSECIKKFFHNLFQYVPCQSQRREDREKIFKILESSIEAYYEELKEVGMDFVYGVLSLIDGERDPRNLDFLFTFMPKFLHKFPLQHLSQDMFEVFACYFPVDFQPLQNEVSVSRQGLASKLADCLVASNDFAEMAISLALEKIDSDIKLAKCDSLELIAKSAQRFLPTLIEPHFEKIWKPLNFIILSGNDDHDVISRGLICLETILKAASTNQEISKQMQTRVLSTILMHLSDPQHKLFTSASFVAVICVRTNPLLSAPKILNCLFLQLDSEECQNEQILDILKITVNILIVCKQNINLQELDFQLLENMQKISIKYFTNDKIMANDSEIIFNYTSEIVEILSNERRTIVYSIITKFLTDDQYLYDIRTFLLSVSKHYPKELLDNCLNNILEASKSLSIRKKENILFNISALLRTDDFKEIILRFFSECIFDATVNCETQIIALQIFREFLDKDAQSDFIKELYTEYKYLDKLIDIAYKIDLSYSILENISIILSFIIKSLDKNEQKTVFDKYVPNLHLNSVNDLYIAKGIVRNIDRDIDIDSQYDRLLNGITQFSLNIEDKDLRKGYHYLLCNLLNRIRKDEKSEEILKNFIKNLEKEVNNNNQNAIEILAWTYKTLMVQGLSRFRYITDLIFQLLDNPQHCKMTVLAFKIISTDYDDLQLPVTQTLFKQQFFNVAYNKLKEKLEGFSQPHVEAFVYILKSMPQPILKINIYKISSILFKCLESDLLICSGIPLEIFQRFLSETDDYFLPHIDHLLVQFLRLTTFKDSMRIRILALECLEAVTKYPEYVLLPHKTDIIIGLAPVIDDKKRLVRKVAVNVRNIWFLKGAL